MKQLENDKLCKYCLGCNKLENEGFEGIRNCKDFVQASVNWRELYNQAILEDFYGGKKEIGRWWNL